MVAETTGFDADMDKDAYAERAAKSKAVLKTVIDALRAPTAEAVSRRRASCTRSPCRSPTR